MTTTKLTKTSKMGSSRKYVKLPTYKIDMRKFRECKRYRNMVISNIGYFIEQLELTAEEYAKLPIAPQQEQEQEQEPEPAPVGSPARRAEPEPEPAPVGSPARRAEPAVKVKKSRTKKKEVDIDKMKDVFTAFMNDNYVVNTKGVDQYITVDSIRIKARSALIDEYPDMDKLLTKKFVQTVIEEKIPEISVNFKKRNTKSTQRQGYSLLEEIVMA